MQAYFAEAGDKSGSDIHLWQSQVSFLIIMNFWNSNLYTFCVSEAHGREKNHMKHVT